MNISMFDLEAAYAFLDRLDPAGKHTFQTFTDPKPKPNPDPLSRTFHGTLAELLTKLISLQGDNAGVYVCINRTDLKGRKKTNITGIRAIAADLDGPPRENIYRFGLQASILVESSPGKYHAWWLVRDGEIPIEKYKSLVTRLAEIVEGDPAISGEQSVLRIPGFFNLKGEPFQSRIIDECSNVYTLKEIEDELAISERAHKGKQTNNKGRGQSALEAACREIKEAKEGTRNATMAGVTMRIVKLVKQGLLDYDVAEEALVKASSVHPDGENVMRNDMFPRFYREYGNDLKPITDLTIRQGDLAEIVQKLEEMIVQKQMPIFHRAERLVRPVLHEYQAEGGSGKTTTFPALRPVSHDVLIKMFHNYGISFSKFDARKGELKEIDPPVAVTNNLMNAGDWSMIPPCSGVINTPTLRSNGTLLSTPGYDPQTRLYLDIDRSLVMPEIPQRPTKKDAERARDLFLGLFDEFPFVSDVDRSCALSAVLTVITRAAYPRSPMFLISANAAGTGKSFLVNALTKLSQGHSAPVISVSSSKEEVEKRLDSLILDGLPCFSLDNVTQNIDGPDKLCQILTEEQVRVRPLGTSDMFNCKSMTTVFATGNQVSFGSDMIRRGLTINLNAAVERPEAREFNHRPDQEILSDRGKYVAAALTIVRAYLVSGERERVSSIASFEEWSRFCREPLVWLGMKDPLESQEEARFHDDYTNNRKSFVSFVEKLYSSGYEHRGKIFGEGVAFKSSEILMIVDDIMMNTQHPLSDEAADQMAFLRTCSSKNGKDININSLGHFLRSLENVIVDGYKMVRVKVATTHGAQWKIVGTKQ